MNIQNTIYNPIFKPSSGSTTQIIPNSFSREDIILNLKPQFFLPGPLVIDRKKTLRSFMKQNVKEISRITFEDFTKVTDMNDKDIKVFFDWVSRLDNLCELNINISPENVVNGQRNSGKHFKKLLRKIHSTPKITSLKINLSHCSEMPSDSFKEFAMKFPHLSKLDINLSSCGQLEEDLVFGLAKSIRCFSCMRELSLNLSNTQLENKGTLALLSSVMSLRFLRYLKLDFSGSQGLDKVGIEGLSKALDNLESLQGLSLNFCQCTQIKNHDVRNLVCSIKKLRSLLKLFLSLVNVGPLNIETLQILMGHGGSFNKLTHLTLRLPSQYEYSEVSKGLARSFVPLANLSVLEISFHDCQTGSRTINKYLLEFFLTSPQLSRICLNFLAISLSVNQMLEHLGRILKNLKLSELDLSFDAHLQIQISTWEILFDGIDALSSLSKLSLNFSDSLAIDPEVIQKLELSLKNTKGLVDFTLGFRTDSGGFTKKTLKSAGRIISKQKNLSALKLTLPGNNNLKSRDFKGIFSTVSQAQFLTKISLDLHDIFLPNHKGQVGPIYYLRSLPALRYFKLGASSCEENQLLALSFQLAHLPQILSIILHFYFGYNISPKTKLKFCKNIRKLKDLKEFDLYIQFNESHPQVQKTEKISWRIKDIYAGYDKAEIEHCEREQKRLKKSKKRCGGWDCADCCYRYCIAFWCIAFICSPGIAILLVITLGVTLG